MTPIATEWSVYSETGVPAWAVACALAATFAVLLVWLRSECRRRPSRLAAILPWTLLLASGSTAVATALHSLGITLN